MFSFASPQTIHFGRGQSQMVSGLAKGFGDTALIVHGATAGRAEWLVAECKEAGLTTIRLSCGSEPSLPEIYRALETLGTARPDVVIALGGGSVVDFAKALSALIGCSGPVESYLEIVGDGRGLDADPIPMIAIPTTAGTGAEVTKNAVISVPDRGLKVSLRDPRMIPNIAIVDAGLMQGAPRRVALSAGLDALTQVIEPYLSAKSNPMSDAICSSAIPTGLQALRRVVEQDCPDSWDALSWVSTCGGLALANSGLGAVHGFAGVIGGKTNAPHGEVCGTLLPCVLDSHAQKSQPGTKLHMRLNWVLQQIAEVFATAPADDATTALRLWSKSEGIRSLVDMGLAQDQHPEVALAAANASSMKGNPFTLSQDDLTAILKAAS